MTGIVLVITCFVQGECKQLSPIHRQNSTGIKFYLIRQNSFFSVLSKLKHKAGAQFFPKRVIGGQSDQSYNS